MTGDELLPSVINNPPEINSPSAQQGKGCTSPTNSLLLAVPAVLRFEVAFAALDLSKET